MKREGFKGINEITYFDLIGWQIAEDNSFRDLDHSIGLRFKHKEVCDALSFTTRVFSLHHVFSGILNGYC